MKGESINMTRARDKEKIRVPDSVREVMGSNPVGDSDFFIVPSRFETIRYGKHSVSISGHSYGQNLLTIKEIRPVYMFL